MYNEDIAYAEEKKGDEKRKIYSKVVCCFLATNHDSSGKIVRDANE